MTIHSKMREWIRLDNEQKEIRARDRSISEEKEKLQEIILDDFAQNGISKIDIDGRLLYAHHELYVGPKKVIHPGTGKEVVPWPVVSHALRDCGYGDYVEERFDSRKLASVIRELKEEDEEIPGKSHLHGNNNQHDDGSRQKGDGNTEKYHLGTLAGHAGGRPVHGVKDQENHGCNTKESKKSIDSTNLLHIG